MKRLSTSSILRERGATARGMLNFVEPHKAPRAEEVSSGSSPEPWDVVPGINGTELYGLIPPESRR